jgi:hypothetical protein
LCLLYLHAICPDPEKCNCPLHEIPLDVLDQEARAGGV